MPVDPGRFARLGYDDFRNLATENGLSPNERIGFPDSYREGRDDSILEDIRGKLTNLGIPGRNVVDVGCGCGGLTLRFLAFCRDMGHHLVLVDSEEVLARLPDGPDTRKVAGRFPQESAAPLADLAGRVDVVTAYSVLQVAALDSNPFDFLDKCLALLAPGGQLLVGDVPNQSMRRRFFNSETGKAFHRAFTGSDSDPEVVFNVLEPDKMDDAVLLGFVMRARAAGFDAFILPQNAELPFANRREDLLFRRP